MPEPRNTIVRWECPECGRPPKDPRHTAMAASNYCPGAPVERVYVAEDALLAAATVQAAAIALNSGWHGESHRCSHEPCGECVADAERPLRAAINHVKRGTDHAD